MAAKKITPEVVDAILDDLCAGYSPQVACERQGIDKRQWYRTIADDAKLKELHEASKSNVTLFVTTLARRKLLEHVAQGDLRAIRYALDKYDLLDVLPPVDLANSPEQQMVIAAAISAAKRALGKEGDNGDAVE